MNKKLANFITIIIVDSSLFLINVPLAKSYCFLAFSSLAMSVGVRWSSD